MTPSTSDVCPEVTFTCTAEDLPGATLRWFLNDVLFAVYSFIPQNQYPIPITPENTTYNALASAVDIQILAASPNEDNLDHASFLSTMTVNISALQGAGVRNVSCGRRSTLTRSYANVTFNSNGGKFSYMICIILCKYIFPSSST